MRLHGRVHNVELPKPPTERTVVSLKHPVTNASRFDVSTYLVDPGSIPEIENLDYQWRLALRQVADDDDEDDTGPAEDDFALDEGMESDSSAARRRRLDEELYEDRRKEAEEALPEIRNQ